MPEIVKPAEGEETPSNFIQDYIVEDLKADSANVMVMIMDVEDTFGITVEDDQIMKLKTVGDVVKYIDANK